jgi:hypothetical protein
MRLKAKTSSAGPTGFADSRATRRARNFVDDLPIGQDVASWSREKTVGDFGRSAMCGFPFNNVTALMVDQLAVRGDLSLDEAAKLAQVAVVNSTLVTIGNDVSMHRQECRVHLGNELGAGGAHAGVLDGAAAIVGGQGIWQGVQELRFLLSQHVLRIRAKWVRLF